VNALFGLLGRPGSSWRFQQAGKLLERSTGLRGKVVYDDELGAIGALSSTGPGDESLDIAQNDERVCLLAGRYVSSDRCLDCQTVLSWFDAHGLQGVPAGDGQHQLAILDRRSRRVVVFADPLGQTPIYYASTEQAMAFAPSQRGVLALLGKSAKISREGALRFLIDRYPSGPACLLDGVDRLGPGRRLCYDLDSGRLTTETYWDLEFRHEIRSSDDAADCLYEAAAQSHRALFAELDAGGSYQLYLTGGLDSRGILGFASRLQRLPEATLTWGAEDGIPDSDPVIARAMSKDLGLAHHFVPIVASDWVRFAGDWALASELASDNASSFASSPGLFAGLRQSSTRFFVLGDQMLGAGPLPGSVEQAIANVMRTAIIEPAAGLDRVLAASTAERLRCEFTADAQALAERCPSTDLKDIQDYLFFHNYINRWIFAPGNFKFPMVPVRRPLMNLNVIEASARLTPIQRVDKAAYVTMLKRYFPEMMKYPLTARDAGVDWAPTMRQDGKLRDRLLGLLSMDRLEGLAIWPDVSPDDLRKFIASFFSKSEKGSTRRGGRAFRLLYDTRRVVSKNRVLARSAAAIQPLVLRLAGLTRVDRTGRQHQLIMRLALLSLFNERLAEAESEASMMSSER